MSQGAILPEPLDVHLVERLQRFDRYSLEELFDRNFDRAYDLAYALTGDAGEADRLAGRAFRRALDGLPAYRGTAQGIDGWLLHLVAQDAARSPSEAAGMRTALGRLPPPVYETVALRLLAGLPADVIAAGSGRRPAQVQDWLAEGLRRLAGGSGSGGGPEVEAAVQRLLRGETPEQATAAGGPRDLAALLKAAAAVRGLPYVPASDAIRSRIRTDYLSTAEERRTRLVHRAQHLPAVPGVDLERRRHERRGTATALALALLLAFGVGIVLAVLSSFADPDSPFYPLKRAGESVLIALNPDPTNRADLEVKVAETRSREAETMAGDRNNADLAVAAMQEHFDLLRAAARDLIAARKRDRHWTSVRDDLESQASLDVAPLERELEQVGAKRQSAQIQADNARFQNDRRSFDPKLGEKPAPSTNLTPGAGPAGGPSPQATPTQ